MLTSNNVRLKKSKNVASESVSNSKRRTERLEEFLQVFDNLNNFQSSNHNHHAIDSRI